MIALGGYDIFPPFLTLTSSKNNIDIVKKPYDYIRDPVQDKENKQTF